MKKGCCDVRVSEMKDGYCIEITGKDVKEKCKALLKDCCFGKNLSKHIQACCGSKE